MIFTGYNPYAPPRATPPHAGDLPAGAVRMP